MTTPEAPRSQEPVEVDPRTLPPPVVPPTDPYAYQQYGQQPSHPQQYGHQPSYGQPYGQQPSHPKPYGQQPSHPQPYGQQPSYGQPYGPPQPSGAPPPVPAWARTKPSALPSEPVTYQQQLRTPRMRWWKPLLTLLLFAVMAVVAINLGSLVLLLVGAAQGVSDLANYLVQVTDVTKGGIGPVSFAFVNFTLIVLIPLAMLARRIVYGQRARFLSSVVGGIRWRWLLRCLACTLPLWAVYIGVSTAATGTPDAKPAHWGVLVVLVLLTTPLQCAGEEYTFRGLVMQTVGSWFKRPMVALIAGAVPAVGLFAAAHGSPDPYILIQLSIFALSCVIVTWRTGGLEAGIAMHLSNNVILMLISIVYGGWGQAFVDSDTRGSLSGVLLEILVDGIAVTLILWQAKRAKIERRYRPAAAPSGRVESVPQPTPHGAIG